MQPFALRVAGTLGLGLALLAGSYAAAAEPVSPVRQDAGAVQFVAPRHLATVLGPSTIELHVAPPAGSRVERVEILVDGRRIATLIEPPWTAPWNAGDGGKDHLLEARLVLTDGSRMRASIRTSRLRIDQVEEVALVSVYAIAKNAEGGYVTDLQASELALSENGREQELALFSSEQKPLRIALVLDTSLSMKGEKMRAAQDAALEFLKALAPGDEGIVVGFSDRVAILHALTADREALGRAVRSAETAGGTAMYDAIWEASNLLTEFEGRRVLVLLSDGRDEAASGLEPGSLHTAEESIDRALRNEVIVFAIGLGDRLAKDSRRLEGDPRARADELDFYGRRPLVAILRQMTDTTGGRAIFTSGPGKLKRAFDEIAADLRHQYTLAYAPDDRRHDGTWREIRLAVSRPGVTVTNRKGYFAPKTGAAN